MAAPKRYDGNLQMFVEEQRVPDLGRLRFLRWLAERGYLEHGIAGAPSGDLSVMSGPAAPRLSTPFGPSSTAA